MRHRYDIAVSTACPSLEYIVVESTSDAQRCVELLRRNNLGVATFLILEKQRHLAAQMADKVQTPEGVFSWMQMCCINSFNATSACIILYSETAVLCCDGHHCCLT